MLLEQLREIVWKCNLELPKNDLVKMTSGNVSGRDPETGLVVIKPSGYSFEEMTPAHMVVVDMDGQVVEGNLKAFDGHGYSSVCLPTSTGCFWHGPYTLPLREQLCRAGTTHSGLSNSIGDARRRNSSGWVRTDRWGGYWSGNYQQDRPGSGHRHAKSRRLYHRLIAAAGDQDGCRSRGDRQDHAPGDAARKTHHAHA